MAMAEFGGFLGVGKLIGEWPEIAIARRDATPSHECPQCGRLKHSAPLTERVRNMLTRHSFNPDYDPDKDDSPILCVYPEEGPAPRHRRSRNEAYVTLGTGGVFTATAAKLQELTLMWETLLPQWQLPQISQPKALTPPKCQGVGIITFDEWKLGEWASETVGVSSHVADMLSDAGLNIELPQYEVNYQPIIDKANKLGYAGVS